MDVISPDAVTTSRALTLDGLLRYADSVKASDLFLKVGSPPAVKRHGQVEVTRFPALTDEDTRRLAYEHVSSARRQHFETHHELNLSFSVPGVSRIRQNVY